jgi:hypothetical protein
MLAIVLVVGIMCAFDVVVVHTALLLGICTALVIQMLGIGPMHVEGLLGRPFVRSLAVATAILVVCLALAEVNPLVRLTTAIVAIAIALPAVLTLLTIREVLVLVVVTSL